MPTIDSVRIFCKRQPRLIRNLCAKLWALVEHRFVKRPAIRLVDPNIGVEYNEDGVSWIREVLSTPSQTYQAASQGIETRAAPTACDLGHRVFAFYLPQFHPFAENNEWWGEGFTEWTNVTKATPQFVGHEQPRLPSDLGFYDLRLPEVMKHQARLAKDSGIEGFCVYFYWFAGKTLMEEPLKNWLKDNTIDFELCLCWANENWTRRWDGQEEDILIGQQHSAQDDLDFIAYISPYLLDPRYTRVDGRPLLLLYYPGLLPDAKETGQRWRKYMRDHHQIELFLMVVHSRDAINPKNIDFDGAVQFPPVGTPATPYSEGIHLINKEFSGAVYNYPQTIFDIVKKWKTPDYFLARGVIPGWDNTARRGGGGHVFTDTHPAHYQFLLHDALLTSRWDSALSDQRKMVFINAWNEWAEGAYLEPDRRFGHAYLNATRDAVYSWSAPSFQLIHEGDLFASQAVLIHVFYGELIEEINQYISRIPLDLDVWVTTPHIYLVEKITTAWPRARVYLTPNRGRDLAPFVAVLPEILKRRYIGVLKLHTKKSKHRGDGDIWRSYLYEQLMPQTEVFRLFWDSWAQRDCLGVVAPDGHLVRIRYFWGQNQYWLERIQQRLKLSSAINGEESFCAGSMFWFRPDAMMTLLQLELSAGDFPPENGYVDATLAHALERAVVPLAVRDGFEVMTMSDLTGRSSEFDVDNWHGLLGA